MKYEINQYPDNTSYVTLGEDILDKDFRINEYKDIWHLKQYVEAYTHKHQKKPLIRIPNLIDAQADRRFADNQSFGLKLVLQELINMDAHFIIFHPHNPEVVEMAFEVCNKKVTIQDNVRFINQVLFELGNTYPSTLHTDYFKTNQSLFFDQRVVDNTILMSADAGGFKPLIKLADEIGWTGETYSASKARVIKDGKAEMHQVLDRENFGGKDILIVDDISVYGGTFKKLAKKLREGNVGKLYLAVSHITVQNMGEDPVTNYFDAVFTTNSKFENYTFMSRDKNHGLIPTTYQPENLIITKMFG